MYVRPLNLLSRLRPEPASLDWVHFLNVGVLILFFALFGSRFVLSPAIVLQDPALQVPQMPEASVALAPSTSVVSIKANGQIFTPDAGRISFEQLQVWLARNARQTAEPSLLIIADKNVSYQELSRLYSSAAEHGFARIALAAEPGVAAP
ncbi:ExbD/TolR family protein [Nibricoccus sp. IMCC34717]|uniref:ExbD/TolR family protein n=1 Tax=Nibricoccus sp. IMCC34717 TaxID=3034021 RepID=UPI00384B13FD